MIAYMACTYTYTPKIQGVCLIVSFTERCTLGRVLIFEYESQKLSELLYTMASQVEKPIKMRRAE